MTEEQANVRYLGPGADHDVPCPLRGCPNPAVLNLGTGVFEPCWRHQSEGWKTNLVKVKNPAWPGIIGVLAVAGCISGVVHGWWFLAAINGLLAVGGGLGLWVRHETRELQIAIRRRAELAGQVEHEGPPVLPAARTMPEKEKS